MGSSYGIEFDCCTSCMQIDFILYDDDDINNNDNDNNKYNNEPISHCVYIKNMRPVFKQKPPISQSRHRYNIKTMIENQKKLIEKRAKRRDRRTGVVIQPPASGNIWYEKAGKINRIVPVDKYLFTIFSDNGSSIESASQRSNNSSSDPSSREGTLSCEIPHTPNSPAGASTYCAHNTVDTEQVTISDQHTSFRRKVANTHQN